MRLFSFILVIGYLFHFATEAADKEPAFAAEAFQIEIKQDDAEFSRQLVHIIAQASENVAVAELPAIPGSLNEAWTAMKRNDRFKRVRCYTERDGWYIFSTMLVDKAQPVTDFRLLFRGFALKKGTKNILRFSFGC